MVIIHGHGAFTHESIDDSNTQIMRKPCQLCGRAFSDSAVTGKDNWVFRVFDKFGCLGHSFMVGTGASYFHRLHWRVVDFHLGDIFGKFDDAKTRFFGFCDLKRLTDDFGDIVWRKDCLRPFTYRLTHPDRIHDLVALFMQSLG